MIKGFLRAELNKLPMKSSQVQQSLDSRYGAQTDLIGNFYLSNVFVGWTLCRLELLLHLQCVASLDVSFLLKSSGSWLSSCWAWVRASSTCFSSASRASLLADRSKIFCFSSSPEDCKNTDTLVFFIGSALYLHHFFCEPGVSSSIGKTLSGFLILELAAF